jgi:two-component system invasion response regulator UvrY
MKVLIVDDHAIVRRGTRELLSEEFPDATFAEAASGEEAVTLAEETAYDLVILDISMPGRGGMDALRELRQRGVKSPVLVLSQHAEEQYAIRTLRAGAQGYLTKESAPEELVHAARRILAGGKYITPSLAERLAESIGADRAGVPHDALSDRELQVLRLIGAGKAVKDIAAELGLSEKTVSTYRTRVLEKMQMQSNAELIRYAMRVGLVE